MVRGSFFQWFPESSSKIMMAWSRFPPKAGSCSICSFHQMAFGGVWQLKIGSELCHRVGRSEGIRRLEEEASKRLERLYDAEGIDSMVQVEDLKLVRLAYVISTERMKNMMNQWQYELLHGGKAFSESFRISTQSTETVFYHMRPALSLKGFTSHQFKIITAVTFFALRLILIFHLFFSIQNMLAYRLWESILEILRW